MEDFCFGRVGGDWVCLRLLGFGGFGDRWLEGICAVDVYFESVDNCGGVNEIFIWG